MRQGCVSLAFELQPGQHLRQHAALASTLMAGLELAQEGDTVLDQDALFGRIVVVPVP